MSRLAVKISDRTGDAAFHFSMDVLEALDKRLDIHGLPTRIMNNDMKAVRLCVRRTLINTDMTPDEIMNAAPLTIITSRLLDAYSMAWRGKSFADFAREIDQEYKKSQRLSQRIAERDQRLSASLIRNKGRTPVTV